MVTKSTNHFQILFLEDSTELTCPPKYKSFSDSIFRQEYGAHLPQKVENTM